MPYVYRITVIHNESANLWHVNLRWSNEMITQWGNFPYRWLAVRSAKRLARERAKEQGDNLRLEVHVHGTEHGSLPEITVYGRDPRSRT